MAVQQLTLEGPVVRQRSRGHLARAWSRLVRKKIAVVSMVTIVVLYSLGMFAPWVSPRPYHEPDFTAIRKPPSLVTDQGLGGFWRESHIAGTDRAGRDLFTRILWGIQNTVILTVLGMLTGGLVIGVSLGLVSGYFGGRSDALIQRTGELLTSLPPFFMVLVIVATLKPRVREWIFWLQDNSDFAGSIVQSWWVDYFVISVALVAFGWFGTARLVRGQVLYLKETQHIEAARAIGSTTPRVLFRHILPNAISPIVVTVSMGMGTMVGVEIFLSWVGAGIQPPRPSLGVMLWDSGHISVLRNEPWMLLTPGAVSFLMMVSWTLLGDALNDVLNPRTR